MNVPRGLSRKRHRNAGGVLLRGAAMRRRRRGRRSEGRGRYRPQGDESVLFGDCRSLGYPDSEEETAVRPDRQGLKVADVLVDAEDHDRRSNAGPA